LEYVNGRVQDMEKDTDFSDLDHLEYLNDKHLLLKSFADQLRETVEKFEEQWHRSAKPPFGQSQTPGLIEDKSPVSEIANEDRFPSTSPTCATTSLESNQSPAFPSSSRASISEPSSFQAYFENNISNGEAATTPPVSPGEAFRREQYEHENNMHEHVKGLIDALAQRGTGNHTCPYGASCNKGGVKDGQFVVFERNSAFRAHLLKHERIYHCTMPYCTAKNGFARVDQLRRHQQHVPHHQH